MTARDLYHAKTLGELLPGVAANDAALPVTGLALDSRKVRPGELFLAYPGEHSDGRAFIDQALAQGAAAVVAEPGVGRALPVPLIECSGLRAQVSGIADRFYDSPSRAVRVVGITGTNGKTSCSQLLGQALRLAGRACGVIGTLGNSLDGSVSGGGLTTPDPIALQAQLANWRARGVTHVAMEVSSHGLSQGRVGGIHFCGAVFTNLTRDHLDYHGSMAAYGAAKATLFQWPGLQFAVINGDDPYGAELAASVAARVPVLGYRLRGAAALCAREVSYHAGGMVATLTTPWGTVMLRSGLLGDFNLSNLLAVIGVLGSLGLSTAQIETLLPQLQPIAGRMERIEGSDSVEVVVDYAHTPDALEHALSALRRHCRGALWCVFGCGGDRDRGKRPLMGAVAERLADRVVVTSDNPRGEEPAAIIAEIRAGMQGNPHIEADRGAAIAFAIGSAAAGDIVLLAGKGHEDYQLVGGQRLPFSDVDAARRALAVRGRP